MAIVDCEDIRLVPFVKFVMFIAILANCAGDKRTKVSNSPGAFVIIEAGECLPLYDTGTKRILITRVQSVLYTVMGVNMQTM